MKPDFNPDNDIIKQGLRVAELNNKLVDGISLTPEEQKEVDAMLRKIFKTPMPPFDFSDLIKEKENE